MSKAVAHEGLFDTVICRACAPDAEPLVGPLSRADLVARLNDVDVVSCALCGESLAAVFDKVTTV